MTADPTTFAKPLEGLRVLEFAQIAAGPFTGMLLADLGADVVKVERPDGGDGMRNWPPLHAGDDGEQQVFSGNFTSLNRNKRSVTLDIKDKADLAKLYALVEGADVFIENFRPGALQRAGLGYDQLKARNPRLIYCSITGYGQTGPYAHKGAFDVTAQAMSGLMSVTGEEGRPPVKCGVPVGDFATGLYAAYVILAAVMRARQTGKGAQVDCSILGSLLGISALQTSEYFGTGLPPRRLGSAHPRNAPYAGFQASDKPFTIAAGNDKLWRDTCAVVGRPDLPDDPRFGTQSLRAKNQNALAEILQPIFATRTAAEWLAELDARGVPCAPINDFAEILADPHVRQAGWVQELTMPNGAKAETVGFPIAISDYAFEITRRPPELGEHNDEVLSEWTERRYATAL
jgi:crotonobetainyl-CoA:carnitine CoA-transferase CaiB-like acyl-CoA transferase